MKTFPQARLLFVVMLVAIFAFCSTTMCAQVGAVAHMLPPVAPSGSVDLGPVAGAQTVTVTLHVAPTEAQSAALMKFLSDVQTPGSGVYRQWLTPQTFGEKFGAADVVASVQSFAAANGIRVSDVAVSASGMRVSLTGKATQIESALAAGLHKFQVGTSVYFANTAAPSLPVALAARVVAVDGLSSLPSAHPLTITADGATATVDDALAALTTAVEANTARVVSLSSTACVEDFDAATRAATQLVLRQAVAQGMTVLAAGGCGARGSAGFPSALSEVTAVAIAPGIVPAVNPVLTEMRPTWQQGAGLPADAFRHEPDVTVSSLAAFVQTMNSILAKEPSGSDGAAARLGNVNATLYQLAPIKGLYTQPDYAAVGTWEAATGLGVVDLGMLGKAFPDGVAANNVQLTIDNPGAVHGQNITFTANVTNTSGTTLPTPTGTITFVTNTGVTVGSGQLVNGSFSATYNQLPANSNYTVVAQYSGDGNYAADNSVTDAFSVTPEPSQITATVASSVPVGGTITVNVVDKSGSGVGTPTGTITVTDPGTPDTNTYTGTLSGSGGTATATVTLPAVQGGALALKVNCVQGQDPSFTCYNPVNVTANVTPGMSKTTLTVSPNPPVQGQNTIFTATVSGAGAGFPTPTGNVNFLDNGVVLGSATISGTTATYTNSNLSGSVTHNFTATYSGDNNYATSTSSGVNSTAGTTTTSLTVNPNPPVAGSTTLLTATIQYTSSGTAPSGTVAFYEDGTQIGTGAVNNGTASYSSTTLSSTTSHTFYAVYSGDPNYLTSTSPNVTTAASNSNSTTGTLTVSPNPPVAGSTTTLVDTIHYTGTNNPGGTVTFFEDGSQLGTSAVNGGIATYTTTAISGKTAHTFYAVYTGDANYTGNTSNTVLTGTNAGISTTTVLTVNPNPPVNGQNTTLTAQVNYSNGGGNTPSGTVTFYEDGTQIGTGSVSNGVATYSSSALSGTSAHTFYAIYGGDGNFNGSTSNTVTTQTGTSTTTTTVSATPTIVATGGTVQLTATVAPATTINGTAPTGSVTFTSSVQGVLGTAQLNGTTATLNPTLSVAGTQIITATYNGNGSYTQSTSSTPATVTVGPSTALSIAVTPSSNVMYGTPVTLAATLNATPTSGTTGPSGQVNFTLYGTVQLTANAALTPTSTTTATGSTTISAPTPGTYSVQATCVGYNFNCTGITATPVSLVTVKANTTTTVALNPATPVAGQQETITATVANANTAASSSASPPSGSVTFYVNGTAIGTSQLIGNTATFSTTLSSATGNTITAVYSGDNNYNTSTSAGTTVTVAPVNTTSRLTAGTTTGLAGSDIIFTLAVSDAPTTTNTSPGTPAGSVTFYDVYNGQTVPLYTTALTASGPYLAVAQFSTVGLMVGTHSVTAVYGGTTAYVGSTSNAVVVNLTDYSVSFSPNTLVLSAGQSKTTTATVTALNGFTGTVTLSCTPPAGTETTCSFSPTTISVSGSSVLTIGTTAQGHVIEKTGQASLGRTVTGVSLAALLMGVLLPGVRKRRPMLMALFVSAAMLGSLGCTNLVNTNPVLVTGGTPLGTLIFTVNTSGNDGKTTIAHNTQLQVTVQ